MKSKTTSLVSVGFVNETYFYLGVDFILLYITCHDLRVHWDTPFLDTHSFLLHPGLDL